MLYNTPNYPSKFKTRNRVEINDDARGTYKTNSQINFKTTISNSSLWDYSHAYKLVEGTITVVWLEPDIAAKATNRGDRQTIIKNCTLFTDCISEINNTEINNAKNLNVLRDKPVNNMADSETFNFKSVFIDNIWWYRYCRCKNCSSIDLNSSSSNF